VAHGFRSKSGVCSRVITGGIGGAASWFGGGQQPAVGGSWSGTEEVSAGTRGEAANDHGRMSVVAALASAVLAWALPGTLSQTSTKSALQQKPIQARLSARWQLCSHSLLCRPRPPPTSDTDLAQACNSCMTGVLVYAMTPSILRFAVSSLCQHATAGCRDVHMRRGRPSPALSSVTVLCPVLSAF